MFKGYRSTRFARMGWFATVFCGALVAAQPARADVVGYYNMTTGEGVAAQVPPITAAGFTPKQMFTLTPAELVGVDVLFVQNSSNFGFGAEYVARLADIQAAVNAGMVLVIHDRRVTNAHTILPGGGAIQIFRNFARDRDIDIVDPVIASGPGGVLTNTSLDNGNSSSHGYANSASLPADARALLSNGLATQIVTFSYPFGSGAVIYSTIPLDFYLAGGGPNPPRENMRQIYAPNILAYAMSLRSQDTTLTVKDASGQYGGLTTLTATLLTITGDPVSGKEVSFSLDGAPVGSATTDADGVALLPNVSLGALGAGSYPDGVGADFAGDDDFNESSGSADLTVTPAPLSITTDDATKLLGDPLPIFTVSYSGFVLAEGPDVLGGALTFTTSADASSPVGTYSVTPGGLTSTNYEITFNPGTLTVTYNICLLYDPGHAANSGSTIPIILRLCDASGQNVSSPSIGVQAMEVVMVPTMATWPAQDPGNANPGGIFRVTGDSYHFNLQTDPSMPSGMYNLMFTVDGDPVSHAAPLAIR